MKYVYGYIAMMFVTIVALTAIIAAKDEPGTQEDAGMIVVSGMLWPITIFLLLGAGICKLIYLFIR